MDKNEMRKEFLVIRDNITNRAEKEQKINKALLSLIKDSYLVLSYMSTKSEVSTDFINQNIKNLALPLVSGDCLIPKLVTDIKKDTKLGSFSIREPLEHLPTATNIDFIIVPGVCFSPDKNRIGYGKGFYDRFLCDKNVTKVGICFEEQMVKKIPTDNFDIEVDCIITDKYLYK